MTKELVTSGKVTWGIVTVDIGFLYKGLKQYGKQDSEYVCLTFKMSILVQAVWKLNERMYKVLDKVVI